MIAGRLDLALKSALHYTPVSPPGTDAARNGVQARPGQLRADPGARRSRCPELGDARWGRSPARRAPGPTKLLACGVRKLDLPVNRAIACGPEITAVPDGLLRITQRLTVLKL